MAVVAGIPSVLMNPCRLLYTFLLFLSMLHLVKNLYPSIPSEMEISANYLAFDQSWSFSLIIFGIHLILVGILVSRAYRKYFLVWGLLAGLSYTIYHSFEYFELLSQVNLLILNSILVIFMTLGELAFAIWLVWKGGKRMKMFNSLEKASHKLFSSIMHLFKVML